jgi:hypothetical protein
VVFWTLAGDLSRKHILAHSQEEIYANFHDKFASGDYQTSVLRDPFAEDEVSTDLTFEPSNDMFTDKDLKTLEPGSKLGLDDLGFLGYDEPVQPNGEPLQLIDESVRPDEELVQPVKKGKRPIQCWYCDLPPFPNNTNRTSHVMSQHQNLPLMGPIKAANTEQCPVEGCTAKPYKDRKGLLSHIRAKHVSYHAQHIKGTGIIPNKL